MAVAYAQIALSFLPTFLYALGGIVDAKNKNEKIDWLVFIKTLVVGAISAGAISQATGDMIVSIAGTIGITAIVDKLINSLLKKGKADMLPPLANP